MKINPSEYKISNMKIWNEIAPRYHERWATASRGPFQSTKKLVQLLDIQSGYKVLDIACGTGVVTKKINQKIGKSGYVIGIDTSITAIKTAKKYNKKKSNILFVNADAENFSFNQKFDAITCQFGLFFFPRATKALKNMRLFLKESGKIGISVHGRREKVPFFSAIFDAVTKFIPDYLPPGTPNLDRYGTKKALSDEVKKSGFSSISVNDFVFKYTPGTFDDYWNNYIKYVAKPIKEKINTLEKSQKKQLREDVRKNTKPFTKRNGTIQFPWEVLILTAKNKRR